MCLQPFLFGRVEDGGISHFRFTICDLELRLLRDAVFNRFLGWAQNGRKEKCWDRGASLCAAGDDGGLGGGLLLEVRC